MRLKRTLLSILFWYLGSFLGLSLIASILLVFRGFEINEILEILISSTAILVKRFLFHLILFLPYLIFLAIRYHWRLLRKRGWKKMMKSSLLYFIIPMSLIVSGSRTVVWYNGQDDGSYDPNSIYFNTNGEVNPNFSLDGKHRGIHIFPTWSNVEIDLEQLVEHNVEWITLVPYGYQENAYTTSFRFSGNRSSRRDSTYMVLGVKANELGLKIFMKPHIWMNGDTWRSDIKMKNDDDWEVWFEEYEKFILHYAQLSNEIGASALCIGTELRETVKSKPEMWSKLINNVKKVYSGQLTYAANWDAEYKEVEFWDELDFIGVQAYFGLSKKRKPSVEDLKEGWQPYFDELKDFSESNEKQILFTEVGYKSTISAAKEPWIWESPFASTFRKVSSQTQANCYEALFQQFWNEPWFAGVHLWKWEGENKFDFTPKKKPAANVMAKWFGQEVRN